MEFLSIRGDDGKYTVVIIFRFNLDAFYLRSGVTRDHCGEQKRVKNIFIRLTYYIIIHTSPLNLSARLVFAVSSRRWSFLFVWFGK
jgi:hypothetical protein